MLQSIKLRVSESVVRGRSFCNRLLPPSTPEAIKTLALYFVVIALLAIALPISPIVVSVISYFAATSPLP